MGKVGAVLESPALMTTGFTSSTVDPDPGYDGDTGYDTNSWVKRHMKPASEVKRREMQRQCTLRADSFSVPRRDSQSSRGQAHSARGWSNAKSKSTYDRTVEGMVAETRRQKYDVIEDLK